MTNYRRTTKAALLFGTIVCSAMLAIANPSAAGAAQSSSNEHEIMDPLRIQGTVSHEGERLLLNDIQGDTVLDQLVLNISDETRILDALNGYPVDAASLKDGETVYAYISPAMALSLPPQSHAEMIICQIPAGFAAPSYETISAATGDSETVRLLTTKRGMVYAIDDETTFLPYLTRNIVTAESLAPGTSCLIWPDRNMEDAGGNEVIHASTVVIFSAQNTDRQDKQGPASDPALTDIITLQ